jgi:hypothetical protein
MNQKKIILSICLGILAVMLLASVGSAVPTQESAYVHVIHYYDGTIVGMTDDDECNQNDIVSWEQNEMVPLSNMIQTTYNGRSYVVDKMEIHIELAELEIQLQENGVKKDSKTEIIGFSDFDYSTELPNHIYIITELGRICSTHIETVPGTQSNIIRKIIDYWTYGQPLTLTYPLTGEITYPVQKQGSSLLPWFDMADIGNLELTNGSHYVLKIFYSSTGGQSSSSNNNNFRVTFNPNDGNNPIITIVSRGGYVFVPDDFAGRNTIWYTDDESFANAWNFETDKVTREMSLYAKPISSGGDRTNEQGGDGQGTGGQGQEATPNPNPDKNDDQKPPQNALPLWIVGVIILTVLAVIGIYLWNKNRT